MRLQAFAKINLGLDVLGKREDGYHEVRMIMQTIRMYDQLDMRKSVEPGIHLTTNKKYIPVDENNLVWRAAKLMMDTCGIIEGVSIHLHKVIPVAAGMAGGSSDAAATLVGMNRLFHCGLSKEKLMELGVQIGADVPYCVLRGTALAEGIGEKLTVLPPMPDAMFLRSEAFLPDWKLFFPDCLPHTKAGRSTVPESQLFLRSPGPVQSPPRLSSG